MTKTIYFDTVYRDGNFRLKADSYPTAITYNEQPLGTRLTTVTASNLRDLMTSTMAEQKPREVIVKNIKAIRCPCCGAPVSKSADHNCDYCGMYLSLEREEV